MCHSYHFIKVLTCLIWACFSAGREESRWGWTGKEKTIFPGQKQMEGQKRHCFTVWEEEEGGYYCKWTIVPVHMRQNCKENEPTIRPEDHSTPAHILLRRHRRSQQTHARDESQKNQARLKLNVCRQAMLRGRLFLFWLLWEDGQKEWEASLENHTGGMCHRQQRIWKVCRNFQK